MHIKISEIKYIKNTSLWRTSAAVGPVNRSLEWPRIELAMLNFCPEAK